MEIFQKSVINKHLASLEKDQIEKAYQKFKENYSPAKIEKIKQLKEEEYQDGFLRDLFVDVFGYTLKPDDNYNLVREFKNQEDGRKADGAILKDEKAIAVIELKSTKTKDLKSITEQAFNYKNNQPDCKYVITSNFQKLRFYIDYANEYEEFDLFLLKKQEFERLYLILNTNSIFSDLPLKLKEETKFHEKEVSEKLYKNYSDFKNKLYENLIEKNPDFDKLTLFKKSQKLLDRFLFILFAEDSGLLPPNSISRIIKRYEILKEEDAYKPLYDIFKQYFGYMNIGRKGKNAGDDIPAYNGGLFYPDELLDSLKIDDVVLIDDLLKLSSFDFNTEVDVNILGHIFEHSLSEIEEITAEIEGIAKDKTKSKRKKDGVFYTPKYITQYIVENTIRKLCTEKREELEIAEIEFDGTYRTKDGNLSAKGKKLYEKLKDYKDWLLSLKIVDPACGSGAFLNQALNFLILEHKNIDDIIAELTNTALRLFDTDIAIIENNLYGVDINEESIEIAKLSLWLRTAQKGRKLSILSNNIKCGNSLIDDPEVAGEKAFDWNKEFAEIMQNGGFDVVIGNPPYVVLSSFESSEFEYLQQTYETAYGRLNLFSLFIEKCCKLIQANGNLGLIIPDSLCMIDYYSDLRKFLLDNYSIYGLFELGDGIFADATVPALLVFVNGIKHKENEIAFGTSSSALIVGSELKHIEQDYYYKTPKYSFNLHIDEVFIKLNDEIDNKIYFSLKDILQIKIGICTGSNKNHLNEDPIYENSKKVLQGKDINKYKLSWGGNYVNYNRAELLRAREEQIFLKSEKLLMRQTSDKLILTYDNNQFYTIDSLFVIYPKIENLNLKYCLALLNSKLLNRQYQKLNPETGRVFAQVKIDYVNELPIKVIPIQEQQVFIVKVELLIELNSNLLIEQNNFLKTLLEEKEVGKINSKIELFQNLSFEEFKRELKKQKIEFALGTENDKWRDYFNSTVVKINGLQSKIHKTNKEIDQMVYELYELTEDEIKIMEENVS